MCRSLGLCLAACLVVTACGGDGGGSTDAGDGALTGPVVETDAVTIENFVFAPASIRVAAGTTVTWTNKDPQGHRIAAGRPGAKEETFDQIVSGLSTAEITFAKAGVFPYYCWFHNSMRGAVEVK